MLSHHHNRPCSVVFLLAFCFMLFAVCSKQACCQVMRALTTVLYLCVSFATCFIISKEICHRVSWRHFELFMACAHMSNTSCDTTKLYSLHALRCRCMSCHVMSCHVMSCHVMSCHVMSCHVIMSHIVTRVVCHVLLLTLLSTRTFLAFAQPCCSCEEA